LLLLPSLAAVALYSWYAIWLPISVDASVFLYTAQGLVDHQAPYLTSWDNKGPLLYILNAAGLLLAGGSPRGAYLLEAGLLAAALLLCVRSWSEQVGHLIASGTGLLLVVTYAIWSNFGLRSETWLFPFQLVTYTFVMRDVRADGSYDGRKPLVLALLVGAVTSLALLMRVNNAAGLAAVAAYLVLVPGRKRRARLFGVMLGSLALILPTLVYLQSQGAIHAFWEQSILYNVQYASGMPLLNRARHFGLFLSELVQAPLWAALVLFAGLAFGRRPASVRVGLLSTLLAIEMVGQLVSGRPYTSYWLVYLPSMAVLVIALASQADLGHCKLSVRRGMFLVALIAPSVLGGAMRVATELRKAHATGYANPASPQARTASYLRSRASSEDKVLVLGYEMSVLVAAGLRSPTTMAYVVPLFSANAEQRARIGADYRSQLRSIPPRFIVETWRDQRHVCRQSSSRPEWERQTGLSGLCAWVTASYTPQAQIGHFRIWAPRLEQPVRAAQ
jgi:hypothetical protein